MGRGEHPKPLEEAMVGCAGPVDEACRKISRCQIKGTRNTTTCRQPQACIQGTVASGLHARVSRAGAFSARAATAAVAVAVAERTRRAVFRYY